MPSRASRAPKETPPPAPLDVWAAARYGDLPRLRELLAEHGTRILSLKHPIPDHLRLAAQEEASWSNHKGQRQHITVAGGNWTPLHVAAAYGQLNTVQWLLQQQVSADARDTFPRLTETITNNIHGNKKNKPLPYAPGWTALHWAAHTGRLDLLQWLLPHTALTPPNRALLCELLQFATSGSSPLESSTKPASTRQLHTWGNGLHFGLGNGTTTNRRTPYPVQGELSSLHVTLCATAKHYTLCACVDPQDQSESLWGWGIDKQGCLGLGAAGSMIALPTRIPFTPDCIAHIAVGPSHSCVVTGEGQLFTFGSNDFGQLGHNDTAERHTPRFVRALASHCITQVAAGTDHTVALTDQGEVYAWGSGAFGQTGLSLYEDTLVPCQVPGLAEETVVAMKAAKEVTVVLLEDRRKLYYFGKGRSSATPMNIPFPGNRGRIVSFTCGENFVAYCTNLGKVYCAMWRSEKVPRVLHGSEVLCAHLLPFQEIDLLGGRAVWVSSSPHRLLVYDQAQQLWEFDELPCLETTHCDVLDHVTQLVCSDYHTAAMVSTATENHLVHVESSQHDRDLLHLLERASYSDLVLLSADGQRFPVHRCVLASQGHAYFTQLLAQEREEMALPMDSQLLSSLLEVFYSGSLSASSDAVDYKTFQAALKQYGLHELHDALLHVNPAYLHSPSVTRLHLPATRFASLLQGTLCAFDVTIQGKGGSQVQAHKALLIARSPYFRALFAAPMRESATHVIALPNSIEAIKRMVEYLYTDELSRHAVGSIVVELLILADQLLLDRLKQLCEEVLASLIQLETVNDLLELGRWHHAPQLQAVCIDYLVRHLYETIERGMFAQFDRPTMEALQARMDQRMVELGCTPPAPQEDAIPMVWPRHYMAAMEEEFRFPPPATPSPGPASSEGGDSSVASSSNPLSPGGEEKAVAGGSRARALRKKLVQVYRIEEKRASGARLNQGQTSKMFQKASLLQQLSDLTGESVESLRVSTMASFRASPTLSPSPLPPTPISPPLPMPLPLGSLDDEEEDEPERTPQEPPTVLEETLPALSEPEVVPLKEESEEEASPSRLSTSLPKESVVPPPGRSKKKGRRQRNSSMKQSFSLTSSQGWAPPPSTRTPSPQNRPQNPPRPSPSSACPWGAVRASPEAPLSLAEIQKEQSGRTTKPSASKPIAIRGSNKPNNAPAQSLSPSPKTGWVLSPSPEAPSFLAIQQQQQRKQKQSQRSRAKNKSPAKSPTSRPSQTPTPPSAPPPSRPKMSLREIMEEEARVAEAARHRTVPSLRNIMGQELTQKLYTAPNDPHWEQQMLEMAIQASLEDQ